MLLVELGMSLSSDYNRKRGTSLIPPVACILDCIQVLLKNTSSLLLISRYLDTCVSEEEEEWDGRYLVLPKNAVGDLIRWITHRGTSAPARERERRRVGSSQA